jgi:hypothetical protein
MHLYLYEQTITHEVRCFTERLEEYDGYFRHAVLDGPPHSWRFRGLMASTLNPFSTGDNVQWYRSTDEQSRENDLRSKELASAHHKAHYDDSLPGREFNESGELVAERVYESEVKDTPRHDDEHKHTDVQRHGYWDSTTITHRHNPELVVGLIYPYPGDDDTLENDDILGTGRPRESDSRGAGIET